MDISSPICSFFSWGWSGEVENVEAMFSDPFLFLPLLLVSVNIHEYLEPLPLVVMEEQPLSILLLSLSLGHWSNEIDGCCCSEEKTREDLHFKTAQC